MKKLSRNFYDRDTITVSKELLGKYLVHNINGEELIGRIVEVEAYKGPIDKAAHSYNRKTDRNKVMYGPSGHAYVFSIYGMYYCMNVVTEKIGMPCAVLIRALEPISGIESMSEYRYNKSINTLSKNELKNLTNGPGKLCIAMGIAKSNYGDDLLGDSLYIAEGDNEKFDIVTTKRINIDYAEEAIHFPWRFYIKGNPYVSKPLIPKTQK